MLAVIELKGKQYRVSPGDIIETDKVTGEDGTTLLAERVLLTDSGTKVEVGTPEVKGAKVELKILAQKKGEKINVRRYKSKVRYRKSTGFRPLLTRLEVVSVTS